MGKYYYPQGGLPPQTHLTTERAIVTEAYTVIPKGVMTDIVTSTLPGFSNTRSWIIARPISGFCHHLLAADRGDRPRRRRPQGRVRSQASKASSSSPRARST